MPDAEPAAQANPAVGLPEPSARHESPSSHTLPSSSPQTGSSQPQSQPQLQPDASASHQPQSGVTAQFIELESPPVMGYPVSLGPGSLHPSLLIPPLPMSSPGASGVAPIAYMSPTGGIVAQCYCSQCQQMVVPNKRFETGMFSWLLACSACCFMCCCCAWVPLVMDAFKDIAFVCPTCHTTLSRYKRM